MSDAADRAAYIAAVLTQYVDLPDTPFPTNGLLGGSMMTASLSTRSRPRCCSDRYAACFVPPGPHGSRPSDPWPTSARSLRNSRRIPSPLDISTTFA
jgi:hypothetical protein